MYNMVFQLFQLYLAWLLLVAAIVTVFALSILSAATIDIRKGGSFREAINYYWDYC
jgi:hypothetical protein